MKRASVSFVNSPAVDDEAKTKLKYKELLNEYLELQKECVSRKRKLPAAKQKRQTILSEVRFLRRRHKLLLQASASNIEKVHLHLPKSDIEANEIERERNHKPSKNVCESLDQGPVTKSWVNDKEDERNQQVVDEKLKFAGNPTKLLVNDKGTGKRKISWPGRVTLKI